MKISLAKTFLRYFILLFSTLILSVLLVSYYVQPAQFYLPLFKVHFFYIPLLLYVLLFALFLSGYFISQLVITTKKAHSLIEEGINALKEGQYQSSIFEDLKKGIDTSFNSGQVKEAESLLQLRNKMIQVTTLTQGNRQTGNKLAEAEKEEIVLKERHRIARELHDSVSQQLFAAMMLLSAIDENSEKIILPRKQLETIQHIINEAQSEMRALLLHLRPTQLEGKTIKDGVEQLLNELKSKIEADILWDIENLYLPLNVENQLFRVFQELLSNILRHAKATEIEVRLKQANSIVLLRIVDDGIGFNKSEKPLGNYGLQNVRERIASLGGTVKIVSVPNEGTSIDIRIPLIK